MFFVNPTIMTNIVSKEFDGSESVMKFIEKEDHDWFGINSSCNNPYGRCRGFFYVKHVSDEST